MDSKISFVAHTDSGELKNHCSLLPLIIKVVTKKDDNITILHYSWHQRFKI
jgi:hypothetical protein